MRLICQPSPKPKIVFDLNRFHERNSHDSLRDGRRTPRSSGSARNPRNQPIDDISQKSFECIRRPEQPQFPDSVCFNLSDSLARKVKLFSYLVQ
jgi:hypothetical protein